LWTAQHGATIAGAVRADRRENDMSDVFVTESRPTELLAALHDAAMPELEHVFANRRAEPTDLVLVAWSEREPAGYLVATVHSTGIVEVWEHAVAPNRRQRGIGRMLLYELARRVPPQALVRVDPAHQLDLQRLADYYSRCGFSHVAATNEILATVADVLRSTGRAPAGNRGAPVKSLVHATDRAVVTIAPDASVAELVALLNEHRIGAVPVSTDGSRIEGIVSERDILHALGSDSASLMQRRVAEVMTRDTITCTADDGIELVMSLMTRLRVRHIPVMESGRLIGIVSIGDIVRQRLEQVERENEQIRDYITTGR
jgi:CBS domain-containing protein/ribosomal protein S18 acetylase RimI-like enzyme